MGKRIKIQFPPIGMRILKSAIAVLLCYGVSLVRQEEGRVFYSQLAALWCMQLYIESSKKMAAQRMIGTLIGATYGLIVILIKQNISIFTIYERAWNGFFISAMIIVVLYTTVLLNKKQASYFSCVVFLSIVVNHLGDSNPYLFVWHRFFDTIIGIVIGVFVNSFRLPKKKDKDTLFVTGLDGVLLDPKEQVTGFCKVELNRLINDGMKFTIATMRTPASLLEPLREIHLQYPIIAMDGAVLYDIIEKRYVHSYVISAKMAEKIEGFLKQFDINPFINVIIDDMLIIYYKATEHEIHKRLVNEMRRSPYRNFVNREKPEIEKVVYYMILERTETIEVVYQSLLQTGYMEELKIVSYASNDYPGYSYIKVYNKNARKENMLNYLKRDIECENSIIIGEAERLTEARIEIDNSIGIIKLLKKGYEKNF